MRDMGRYVGTRSAAASSVLPSILRDGFHCLPELCQGCSARVKGKTRLESPSACSQTGIVFCRRPLIYQF